MRRVLDQAVARVEHLVRKEEGPLAGDAAVVERVLALELDHEPLAEVLRLETHDRREPVLEDPPAAHAHVALGVGDQAHRQLASEVDDLPPVVPLVLRRQPRVVPRGCTHVVVQKVYAARRRHVHFRTRWQRT